MIALGRSAIRKGFLGGSSFWRVVGVVVFLPKLWRALFGRRPESVTIGPLAPGEGVEIRAVRRG